MSSSGALPPLPWRPRVLRPPNLPERLRRLWTVLRAPPAARPHRTQSSRHLTHVALQQFLCVSLSPWAVSGKWHCSRGNKNMLIWTETVCFIEFCVDEHIYFHMPGSRSEFFIQVSTENGFRKVYVIFCLYYHGKLIYVWNMIISTIQSKCRYVQLYSHENLWSMSGTAFSPNAFWFFYSEMHSGSSLLRAHRLKHYLPCHWYFICALYHSPSKIPFLDFLDPPKGGRCIYRGGAQSGGSFNSRHTESAVILPRI